MEFAMVPTIGSALLLLFYNTMNENPDDAYKLYTPGAFAIYDTKDYMGIEEIKKLNMVRAKCKYTHSVEHHLPVSQSTAITVTKGKFLCEGMSRPNFFTETFVFREDGNSNIRISQSVFIPINAISEHLCL